MNTKIFISHQQDDKDKAEEIAKYLKSNGIDVYFDEFDHDLQIATILNKPEKVVEAIKKGIKNSTHMVCIVSPSTIKSYWVPFEIGYGYDITVLITLTLKGIIDSDLPDYMKIAPIIRKAQDLNRFIRDQGKGYILESKNFSNTESYLHPLRNIMDI